MKDWFVKRLTPRKAQEPRWADFASALQGTWETYFDPELSRLERLRSYYQADDRDLGKMLLEMGDTFSDDGIVKPEDKPIAVAWRRLELEYKDLERILSSVFRRHFGNLPTAWFPIFAPIDETYGMVFTPAQGPWPERKNIPPDGMFLTSRGMLGTDFSHLLQMGMPKAVFLEKAVPLLKRTKPLHIVYDGPLFYIRFDIPFELDFDVTWSRDDWTTLLFSTVGARFDFIPADEIPVDLSTMSCRWERVNDMPVPFTGILEGRYWRQDWCAVPVVAAGLDAVLSRDELATLLFSTVNTRFDSAPEDDNPLYLSTMSCRWERKDDLPIPFAGILPGRLWHLDWHVPEGFSPDWIPLDTVVAGTEGENAIFHMILQEHRHKYALPMQGASARYTTARDVHSVLPVVLSADTSISVAHHFPVKALKQSLSVLSRERTEELSVTLATPDMSFEEVRSKPPSVSPFAAECATFLHESTVHAQFSPMKTSHHLDQFPRFDEVPADFCPLDMPVGGFYV